MIKKVLEYAARTSCGHAWLVISAAVLLTAAGGWVFATRLSVVTDTDAMIDPQLPYRQAYASFQAAYPQLGNTLAVLIESDAAEMRQRAAEALAQRVAADKTFFDSIYAPSLLPLFQDNGLLFLSYDELADRLDELVAAQPLLGPLLRNPSAARLLNSLAEAMRERSGDTDTALIQAAIDDVARVAQAVQSGEQALLSLQSLLNQGEEGDFTILIVQPRLDPSRIQPAKPALNALRSHIQSVQSTLVVPVDISLTGKVALNAEELKSVSAGASLAGLLSVLLVATILFFGTRSVRAVLAMVANLVVGLVLTGAAALLLFGSLNIISVAFAVLFIGLGIDFAIHLLLRAREVALGAPLSKAFEYAAGTSGLALALCAPTTALAFLSFTPTDYAGLSQLGVIAAMGVFIAFLSSVTVLPALLTAMGVKPRQPAALKGSIIQRAPKSILIAAAIVFVPAVYFAADIKFSADPVSLKDPSSPSVAAYQRLLSRDTFSPYVMHVTTPNASQAQTIAQAAATLDGVGRTLWLGSYVPKEQSDKLELIEETNFLLAGDLIAPEDQVSAGIADSNAAMKALAEVTMRAEFEAFLFAANKDPALWARLEQALLETVPDLRTVLQRQLSATALTQDDVPPQIVERYRGRDASFRIEIFPEDALRDEQALARFVQTVTQRFPSATGSPVQIVRSGKIVKRAMGQATLTAFVLVGAFLMLVLRSPLQVALVLFPVGLAGVATLASAVLLDLTFNFANVIVLPLLLGLGVDAGIHYVRRAFEGGSQIDETGSTGQAVLLSALTTIGSFGTLMVSSHAGTASMGQLLTLALFWLLVTTLVVLPALLVLLAKRQRGGGA